MSGDYLDITPASYMADRMHRQITDRALAEFGLLPEDCIRLEVFGEGRLQFTLWQRNEDGTPAFDRNDNPLTMTLLVNVPGSARVGAA